MGRETGIKFDADKLRNEIIRQGHTIRSFNEVCGYFHPMVQNTLDRGRCRATTLKIFADALGMPVSEFFPDETKKMKVMLDYGAKMPTRAHEWDAGYDLFSMEEKTIPKGGSYVFDTGVHMQIPPGYCGLLVSKSGLHCKEGLQSTGLIDSGYTGSIRVKLTNHGTKTATIKEYQKISQLVIIPIITPELEPVDSMESTERGEGGFGSSGKF